MGWKDGAQETSKRTWLQLDQASPVPRSAPTAWFTYLSVLPYLNCTGEDGSKVAQVWSSPGEAPSPQTGEFGLLS